MNERDRAAWRNHTLTALVGKSAYLRTRVAWWREYVDDALSTGRHNHVALEKCREASSELRKLCDSFESAIAEHREYC